MISLVVGSMQLDRELILKGGKQDPQVVDKMGVAIKIEEHQLKFLDYVFNV